MFLDGPEVPDGERQPVAHELGFAETVFVDDRETATIRIFTPEVELPLAGHPLVGTAWVLAHEATPVATLHPPAGEVLVRYGGDLTWIAAKAEWAPPFEFVELGSPDEVDALTGAPQGKGMVGAWAWIDESAGLIRERVFVPEAGIPEDEATGAAAMRLVALLGREIEIRQGRGSVIQARPAEDGFVEIGGRVVLDEVREQWAPSDSNRKLSP